MVMVFGEITTKAKVDYEAVVRAALLKIGYDAEEKGLDGKVCYSLSSLVVNFLNTKKHDEYFTLCRPRRTYRSWREQQPLI